jgi:multiple antibiotic resistance protein
MVRDDPSSKSSDAVEGPTAKAKRESVGRRFERMIVPFAMPLLIGPGAISTVIIQAGEAQAHGLTGHAVGLLAIAAVGVSMLISFFLSAPLSHALGKVGMAIVVRVLGLVLCAMAVQFILAGANESTRGLIRQTVAQPYVQQPGGR